MNPYLIGIGALAGYAVVTGKNPLAGLGGPTAPIDSSKEQKTSAWPSWMNIGDQPASGQGQNPTETVGAVANAVGSIAKLGSQLASYWGTHNSDDAPGSVGTNGSGASEWALPDFGSGDGSGFDKLGFGEDDK